MSLSSNISTSTGSQNVYIKDLPPTLREELCRHLDDLNVWEQLGKRMSLHSNEMQQIKLQEKLGRSPTEELLKIFGGLYHHDVKELFAVLYQERHFQALRLLKDYVPEKYQKRIPASQPHFSVLLASNGSDNGLGTTTNNSAFRNTTNGNTTDDNESSSSSSSYNVNNNESDQQMNSPSASNPFNAKNQVGDIVQMLTEINYQELTAATNNWDRKNILGSGGFGTVYSGVWKHTHVAIKQLQYNGNSDDKSIKVELQQSLNELKYLTLCRHDNVVALYGYSIKGEKPCLVYQLMKGGTLENRLYSTKTRPYPPLTFQQRVNILLGTARGINFLHIFHVKPLIHGDIKPANVLLDECLHPRIGDFGLAREGPNALHSSVLVSQPFGTKPYVPRELKHQRKLSTKVDTYSFGVVVLETFTGLRAYDRNRECIYLTDHIHQMPEELRVEQLLNSNFTTQDQELSRYFIRLGIRCIAPYAQQRPEMEEVLKEIENYPEFELL